MIDVLLFFKMDIIVDDKLLAVDIHTVHAFVIKLSLV